MRLSSKCYAFLTIFFFISCASKINIVETETNSVKDSIIVHKKKEVIPAIKDTLFVKSPCDSLGNLKDFEKEIRTPKSSVLLRSRKGKIEVLVEQDTLIVSHTSNVKVRESSHAKTSDKKKVVHKTSTTIVLILIISILLNILLIKMNAKKFTPFL